MACNEVVWPVVSYRQHTPSVSGSLPCVSWTRESLYLWPCIDCLRGMNFTLVTLVSFFGHACCYGCKARLANFGFSEYIGSRFPIPNVPCGACDNREFDWCMGWFTFPYVLLPYYSSNHTEDTLADRPVTLRYVLCHFERCNWHTAPKILMQLTHNTVVLRFLASPKCTLHAAINHVITVLEQQILMYFQWHTVQHKI